MGIWDHYQQGARAMLFALQRIAERPGGFAHPEDPARITAGPAPLTILKNGLEVYSRSDERFVRFRDHFTKQCENRDTHPETFHTAIYADLTSFLENELE